MEIQTYIDFGLYVPNTAHGSVWNVLRCAVAHPRLRVCNTGNQQCSSFPDYLARFSNSRYRHHKISGFKQGLYVYFVLVDLDMQGWDISDCIWIDLARRACQIISRKMIFQRLMVSTRKTRSQWLVLF